MVIMEQCDLKQLHLRPVRIHYVSPQSKTILNGPWITHVDSDASLVRFYHPASIGEYRTRAVLADEFQVQRIGSSSISPKYLHLEGFLRYGGQLKGRTCMPYSDEDLAEAILFRTQIAYLIEDVNRFWQVLAETATYAKK